MSDINQINNEKVLVRVCYDLSNDQDVSRILDSKDTIDLLLNNNNKVILITHWGRPMGKTNSQNDLGKLITIIEKNLEQKITFLNQYELSFSELKIKIEDSNNKLFLLQNSRFSPDEDSKNQENKDLLAQKYASLANYFVDEAFPVSHRKEVTNFEIKKYLKSCFGLSYEKELKNLDTLKNNPQKPFIAVMAGAKLETKLPLITKMLPLADKILLGGLLCFSFIEAAKELKLPKYANIDLGHSPIEKDFVETAKKLLLQNPEKIILPLDFEFGDKNASPVNSDSKEKIAYDIGSKTILEFQDILKSAKTIFWNGTMGFYEKPPFNRGTLDLAKFVGSLQNTFKVVGGGDTHSALPENILKSFNFVSMGGGATLEYLSK